MNLSENDIGNLQELVNIGVGQAAGILNEMLCFHIELQVPFIKIISSTDLKQELEGRLNGEPLSLVDLSFSGLLMGSAQLIFPKDSASMLVTILTGETPDTPDLDAVKIGTLLEVGNILLNGVMGAISNTVVEHFDYSLPTYREGSVANLLSFQSLDSKATILLAKTFFSIETLKISGQIILILQVGGLDVLLNAINLLAES